MLKYGILDNDAVKIVTFTGGRLVHLQTCVILTKDQKLNMDNGCEEIKRVILSRALNAQKIVILKCKPESDTIVSELSKQESVLTTDLISKASEKTKMEEVIQHMIEENILRYGIKGEWHGRIQQDHFQVQGFRDEPKGSKEGKD